MYAPGEIERILIIRHAPLGETVLTTPVIRALRQHFHNAYIAYMVAPTREDLVSANPHLDEVLIYQSSIPKLLSQLIRRKFQLAVVLQPTFRLVLHTFLARIPLRIGFQTNTAGKKLLKHSVPNNTSQHETQRYLDVVRSIGIEVEDDEPEVFIDEAGMAWVDEYFKNNYVDDEKPIIGLNPGAATSYRRWAADNFATLGNMLHEAYDCHILITTGPQERELSQKVSSQMKYKPLIVDNITPMQLAAILKKCNLYISNDTGPMHLSTAVKTHTIGIFGGSNPTQWGPPWEKHTIIAREECKYMKTLSPKEWDEYANVAQKNLEWIKPETVFAATEKMKWNPQDKS
ncbi:glycosyltransferase family 9 protein [Candidatus Poribacteria bacterium]|nr:glycosyltransferase family 9 protein [Candidatus Poribacteria bacterium]